MSCASIDFNFLPFAILNVSTQYLNKSFNGSGPDARPPKVLSLAPAGLTFDISQFGI